LTPREQTVWDTAFAAEAQYGIGARFYQTSELRERTERCIDTADNAVRAYRLAVTIKRVPE
jgi:hypothetical protein